MIPDGELLRRYTETNSESAFTELVERHLALVYSAALRQANGDAHLARDVAQTVFADLARKAASLAGRPVLTGWLYTSALYAAAKVVRTEQRRHSREQEAHLMNQLLSESAPDLDWEKLRPVLDAAMLELNETDREAVLLRYFDNRPHAEIADRLGLSENAARMRVERALEKLHAVLSSRGVSTTAALFAVISVNAVQVAPAGLAATLSTAAIAGTALATTATAIKALAMTTLKKTLIAATIVAAASTGIYETRRAATLRSENQALQQQHGPLIEEIQRLQQERDETARRFVALREENERFSRNNAELLKLRGEVGLLRNVAHDSKQVESEPMQDAAKAWVAKVDVLKRWIEQRPEQKIPEFQYLQEYDWLDAVKTSNMMGPYAPMNAMRGLREAAKRQFAHELSNALRRFVEEHNGDLPAALSQLNAYFQLPMNDAILKSYELLHAGKLADLPQHELLVTEIAPPFEAGDTVTGISIDGSRQIPRGK